MAIYTIDSENRIFDFLKQIEAEHNNHYAIHFHLSKLLERNKSDFQIKIALNILGDFFKKNTGNIYLLTNSDLMVIFESNSRDLVEKIIFQLRYLFIDDPLAFKARNVKNPEFSSIYVLAFQWDDFQSYCKKTFNITKISNVSSNEITNSKQSKLNTEKVNPFAQIEHDLEKVDYLPLLRKQNISLSFKEDKFKPIFQEIYINLSNLRNFLKYDHQFLNSKLLYKFMSDKVDFMILNLLKNNISKYISMATNINLNIDCILSDEFLEFHKLLRSTTNASFVIDIDLSDVFMDLNSFYYASDYLKDLGYKTCLDGVDSYSLSYINRESLGVDLIKLKWDPDLSGQIERSIIKDYIEKSNPNRIILTNCDDQEAIEYGRELGIFLFQGWWVEKVSNYKILSEQS